MDILKARGIYRRGQSRRWNSSCVLCIFLWIYAPFGHHLHGLMLDRFLPLQGKGGLSRQLLPYFRQVNTRAGGRFRITRPTLTSPKNLRKKRASLNPPSLSFAISKWPAY